MIALHTVYVVTLVSQATSALVLLILAWVDRRSRWLVPLAMACGLHAAAIYLMPLWRGTGRWFPQALSLSNLIGMFYLIHLGLQGLLAPSQRRSARMHTAVGALMLLVFALAAFSSLRSIEAASVIAIVLIARTVRMLWKAKVPDLLGPLRATAALLSAIIAEFAIRLPMEAMVHPPPVFLLLQETTLMLVTLMAFSFLALYAAESRRRLHEETRLDALTGLPNRRAMEEEAARQTQLAARQGKPCSLLMLDLDDFKTLNDSWGHDVGDRALQAAGSLLRRTAQEISHCTVARMGGEEFAIMLCDWSVTAAQTLAEQLRAEMALLQVNAQDQVVGFSASIGISALLPGESTWTEMLRRADVALYRAKREGRNRVVLCTEATPGSTSSEKGGRRRDSLPLPLPLEGAIRSPPHSPLRDDLTSVTTESRRPGAARR